MSAAVSTPARSQHADLSFEAMGTTNRVIVGPPLDEGPSPAAAAENERRRIEEFDRALSRFRPDSELSRLNADQRERVPASALLLAAVGAGLDAARLSGGLVDPTLVDEIEAAGYTGSRSRAPRELIAEAIAHAPDPHPAGPDPRACWRAFRCDIRGGTISRPRGLRFDTGGTGKGLAADLSALALAGFERCLVSCGGDIRVDGPALSVDPYEVMVAHPLSGELIDSFELRSGAVATSGIDSRVWRTADGYAHHLLDPATAKPAWTGLLSVTALAPTGVEAEALAKTAFLRGAEGARALLAERGGLIVFDDGSWERIQ